jgi:hypothetical protein
VIAKDSVMMVLDYFFSIEFFLLNSINVNIEVFLLFFLKMQIITCVSVLFIPPNVGLCIGDVFVGADEKFGSATTFK